MPKQQLRKMYLLWSECNENILQHKYKYDSINWVCIYSYENFFLFSFLFCRLNQLIACSGSALHLWNSAYNTHARYMQRLRVFAKRNLQGIKEISRYEPTTITCVRYSFTLKLYYISIYIICKWRNTFRISKYLLVIVNFMCKKKFQSWWNYIYILAFIVVYYY